MQFNFSNISIGRQLSSDPETQVPNTVSNHLTSGILKYIYTTGRYTSGINLFEKLRTRDVEVSSLLARVQIMADEEVQAVRLLYDALQDVPMDYALLDCQADFCQRKGEGEMALECAKRAVTAAPSEFSTWARLAEVYVGLEQWDLALLTLNSCPMFTYQDKDTPRMPQPSRIMLPILSESILDEIDEGQPKQGDPHDYVHPSLRKLHAAGYQGTFLKAYNLLTKIAAAIGWDQLLKTRSEVFVMEEEYRVERQHVPKPAQSLEAETNGEWIKSDDENDDDSGSVSGPGPAEPTPETTDNVNGDETKVESAIERPEQSMASEVVKSGNDDVSLSSSPSIPKISIFLLTICLIRPTHHTTHTHNSGTSAFVSVGWTTCSWCFMKISASTLSGEPKWPSSASKPWNTRSPLPNGKSWVILQSACTTLTRVSRPTKAASAFGSRPRLCAVFSSCTKRGMIRGVCWEP